MAALTTTQLKARMAVMRGTVVDTTHDFTAMTSAQVLAAYGLSSLGGDGTLYVPDANGDFVARDHNNDAPVSDAGLFIEGPFTEHNNANTFTGAVTGVIGSGGALPTGWAQGYTAEGYTVTVTTGFTAFGLPVLRLRIAGTPTRSGLFPCILAANSARRAHTGDTQQKVALRLVAGSAPYQPFTRVYGYDGSNNSLGYKSGQPAATLTNTWDRMLINASPITNQATLDCVIFRTNQVAGTPYDFTLELCAPSTITKKYSNIFVEMAATTPPAHLQPIIQGAVDLRGPFAVELVATTAPGDPGAHQTIWCQSLGANDYAQVYRATSTNQITLKVRANSTDYSVACGAVANSTQFTLRLGVLFNKVLWSLNGSTAAALTIKRSASYVLKSLGTFYDGTLPAGGSVQSVRVAAGKIATAAEIEGGWA